MVGQFIAIGGFAGFFIWREYRARRRNLARADVLRRDPSRQVGR